MKKCILVLLSFLVISASAQSPDKLTGPYLGQKLPGTTRLFAPGIVVSKHASVTISRDGKEIYWSNDRIYVTTYKNGRWTKPEAVPFTRDEGGDGPKLSPDDRELYFNSDRPPGRVTRDENESGASNGRPAGGENRSRSAPRSMTSPSTGGCPSTPRESCISVPSGMAQRAWTTCSWPNPGMEDLRIQSASTRRSTPRPMRAAPSSLQTADT